MPTIIKFQKGTLRKSRVKNEPEPEVLMKPPMPPGGLPRLGRRLWIRQAEELVALGVLTTADLEAFGIACMDYGLAAELYRDITHVLVIKGKGKRRKQRTRYRSVAEYINELAEPEMVDGVLVQKPQIYERAAIVHLMRGLHKDAIKIFTEFGLTPASRSRLDLPSPEKPGEDPVKRMMNA